MCNNRITIDAIRRATAKAYGLDLADMTGPRRTNRIARPRQIAMALARRLTNHSLPAIGLAFGGRDHTTVLYAVRRIAQLEAADATFKEDVSALQAHIVSSSSSNFDWDSLAFALFSIERFLLSFGDIASQSRQPVAVCNSYGDFAKTARACNAVERFCSGFADVRRKADAAERRDEKFILAMSVERTHDEFPRAVS